MPGWRRILSNRWTMNSNWFQMAMLAYNLNCWLMLFSRERERHRGDHETYDSGHRAAAVFCFWPLRSGGTPARVGVSYSDQYQEKGAFQQLMDRLRKVARGLDGFTPVLSAPLRA